MAGEYCQNQRMKVRGPIALATLAFATCVVVAWTFIRHEPEPSYQGHPLRYWVHVFSPSHIPRSPNEKAEAAAALRGIGPNAIPFLLRWVVDATPPTEEWRMRLAQCVRRVSKTLGEAVQGNDLEKSVLAEHSAYAFGALGEQAREAIPALEQLATQRTNGLAHLRAMTALAGIRNAAPK